MTTQSDLKRYTEANRAAWNEVMPLHQRAAKEKWTESFSRPGFVALDEAEIELWQQVGLPSKRVAQLLCNNGVELMSLKNMGAEECVGFDISDEAIKDQLMRIDLTYADVQFAYRSTGEEAFKTIQTREERQYPQHYWRKPEAECEAGARDDALGEQVDIEEEEEPIPTVEDLIAQGESEQLEFKSSLQWDYGNGDLNAALRKAVIKSIAAFLNTAGGRVLIGVQDDGAVLGLENDLKTTRRSKDRYANLLATLISDYLGAEFSSNIRIRFEPHNDKEICVIQVKSSSDPVYYQGDTGSEFYVRLGPTTRMLDTEESVVYLRANR